MKKCTVFLLIFAFALSMAACNNDLDKTISYTDLNLALQSENYATKVAVGGEDLDATLKELDLPKVETAATVSFLKETDGMKSNGFAYVFSFYEKDAATTAFATMLKMCMESGLPIQTVESENGKKAVYQAGNASITILSQVEDTVVYATEYCESGIKGGAHKVGIGKILEKLGY